MHIQPVSPNFNFTNKIYSKTNSSNPFLKENKLDSFEKQNANISFTSSIWNPNKENETTLGDALAIIGISGGALLLSLTIGMAMAKGEDVDDIFMDDSGFDIDTDELSFKSSNVVADSDDGIFQVKGTGIDINPDRFNHVGDIFDPENGIYKTADGSVDIDLLNNKYIDTQNGIFVDPENRISAFVDENGDAKHFALPSFMGYQTWPYPVIHSSSSSEHIPNLADDGLFKTLIHDIKNSPLFHDLFNREVAPVEDEEGNQYLTTVPSDVPEIFREIHSGMSDFDEAVDSANDKIFGNYLNKNFPSFDEFLENTRSNAQDGSHFGFGNDETDSTDNPIDPLSVDLDGTGIPDYIEHGLTPEQATQDLNDNGIPDWLEGDMNGNGIPDYQELN